MERKYKLIRELNTSDVEIYQLQENSFSENTICYFMLFDTHRKATLEDFPYLKGVIGEEELEGDNYIKSLIVSDHEADEVLNEELQSIIEGLTFHLFAPSQEWNYSHKIISSKEFKKIQTNRNYMLNFFDNILKNEKYVFTISTIKEDDYNYLTQPVSKR